MSILLQSVPGVGGRVSWWPPAGASTRGARAARRRPLYLIYDGRFGEWNVMESVLVDEMKWNEPSHPSSGRTTQRIFTEGRWL